MAYFESLITIPFLSEKFHSPLKKYFETTYQSDYQSPQKLIKLKLEVTNVIKKFYMQILILFNRKNYDKNNPNQ